MAKNTVELIGKLAGLPAFSHIGKDGTYHTFPLEVRRLSGAADTLNVLLREELLPTVTVSPESKLRVTGELRSFNNRSGVGSRLVISVLARTVQTSQEEDANLVELEGTLCKLPVYRKTPMGREICDLMLAVNRRYNRSDYLPCIVWGRLARESADWDIGSQVLLIGRIQSRKYIKVMEEVAVEKTAFEVSASEICRLG